MFGNLNRRLLVTSFSGGLAVLASVNLVLADAYKVDPVHSSIIWRAQHVQAGYTFGKFDSFSGTLTTDADPSKMSLEITAKTDSIDSGNEQRDKHLKSNTFFSAAEFPTISFKSTSVKPAGENKLEVTGDMTLHGQTKSITITLEKVGESKQMGERVGYFTTFTVKRSDYGMGAMPQAVSDEIQLQVAVEGVK